MNVFCYVQRIRIGQNIRLIKLHFCGVHFFLLLCFAFCFALSCLWAIWLSRLLAQISLAIFFSYSTFFFQKKKKILVCDYFHVYAEWSEQTSESLWQKTTRTMCCVVSMWVCRRESPRFKEWKKKNTHWSNIFKAIWNAAHDRWVVWRKILSLSVSHVCCRVSLEIYTLNCVVYDIFTFSIERERKKQNREKQKVAEAITKSINKNMSPSIQQ